MNSIEDSVRLELIQLGGVLVLDRPKPGEELVYNSVRYILIDFRDVFGEWQSLARSGKSLLAFKFGDNTSIRLDHFFNKGVGAPTRSARADRRHGGDFAGHVLQYVRVTRGAARGGRQRNFRAAPGPCRRRWCFRLATTILVRSSATRTR